MCSSFCIFQSLFFCIRVVALTREFRIWSNSTPHHRYILPRLFEWHINLFCRAVFAQQEKLLKEGLSQPTNSLISAYHPSHPTHTGIKVYRHKMINVVISIKRAYNTSAIVQILNETNHLLWHWPVYITNHSDINLQIIFGMLDPLTE